MQHKAKRQQTSSVKRLFVSFTFKDDGFQIRIHIKHFNRR